MGTSPSGTLFGLMVEKSKRVVVAEDDPLLRLLVVDVLSDAGFNVFDAEHAKAALTELESNYSHISLLFTDIMMPGEMNGIDLARHVSRSWPHIALLITSATDRPGLVHMPTGSIFLSKPYHTDDMLAHALSLTEAA